MPETITISVPITAIDAAMRERIVSLEDERDAVLGAVGPLDGETLAEAVSRICRERDAARGHAPSAVAVAIRQALGAKPDERTVDAAGRVVRERDEARKDLAVAENTLATALRSRDEWFDAHESMRQERDAARADLIVARGLDQTVRDILKIRDGVSLIETVERLVEERDEDRSEYADLRLELFANREESAIDAARRVVQEAKCVASERDAARRDTSAALGVIGDIGKAVGAEPGEDILDAAKRVAREANRLLAERDGARNCLRATDRVATLETAIRTLAKVLP